MDISFLVDTPFGDQSAFADFLFANSRAHHDVATNLEQMGMSIDSYPLTEMGDPQDWLAIHGQVHNQELEILGLNPNIDLIDLGEVDLQDEKQYCDWMYNHALIHQYVNNALGLI